MIRAIKITTVFMFLLTTWEIKAQSDLKTHLIGQWTVKEIYDIGAQIPADSKDEIKIAQNAFMKAKFQFKKDSSFYLDIPFQEMAIKNGHWKILKDNNEVIIQEWKDKDKSGPVLMGITVLIKDGKTIFIIEETFLAFEMIKISAE